MPAGEPCPEAFAPSAHFTPGQAALSPSLPSLAIGGHIARLARPTTGTCCTFIVIVSSLHTHSRSHLARPISITLVQILLVPLHCPLHAPPPRHPSTAQQRSPVLIPPSCPGCLRRGFDWTRATPSFSLLLASRLFGPRYTLLPHPLLLFSSQRTLRCTSSKQEFISAAVLPRLTRAIPVHHRGDRQHTPPELPGP